MAQTRTELHVTVIRKTLSPPEMKDVFLSLLDHIPSQWFHEEERESECGGGSHQAGHQTQR